MIVHFSGDLGRSHDPLMRPPQALQQADVLVCESTYGNRKHARVELSSLAARASGGTLDVDGLLFANRCTWAHLLGAAANVLSTPATALLDADEIAAIEGRGDPTRLWRQTT